MKTQFACRLQPHRATLPCKTLVCLLHSLTALVSSQPASSVCSWVILLSCKCRPTNIIFNWSFVHRNLGNSQFFPPLIVVQLFLKNECYKIGFYKIRNSSLARGSRFWIHFIFQQNLHSLDMSLSNFGHNLLWTFKPCTRAFKKIQNFSSIIGHNCKNGKST